MMRYDAHTRITILIPSVYAFEGCIHAKIASATQFPYIYTPNEQHHPQIEYTFSLYARQSMKNSQKSTSNTHTQKTTPQFFNKIAMHTRMCCVTTARGVQWNACVRTATIKRHVRCRWRTNDVRNVVGTVHIRVLYTRKHHASTPYILYACAIQKNMFLLSMKIARDAKTRTHM